MRNNCFNEIFLLIQYISVVRTVVTFLGFFPVFLMGLLSCQFALSNLIWQIHNVLWDPTRTFLRSQHRTCRIIISNNSFRKIIHIQIYAWKQEYTTRHISENNISEISSLAVSVFDIKVKEKSSAIYIIFKSYKPLLSRFFHLVCTGPGTTDAPMASLCTATNILVVSMIGFSYTEKNMYQNNRICIRNWLKSSPPAFVYNLK